MSCPRGRSESSDNDGRCRSRSPRSVMELDPILEDSSMMFPEALPDWLARRERRKATKRGGRRSVPHVPRNSPAAKAQGEHAEQVGKSLMRPMALAELHPFAPKLHEWERGVPVDCGQPWTKEAINLALEKGPHRSALDEEAIRLVHEDVAYQVEAGFSQLVYWDDIKDNLPRNFKLSPLAVIP